MTTVDCIQLRSDSIIHYRLPLERNWRRYTFDPNTKTYSGKVTDHVRKRLLSACDILVQQTPARWIYNPVSESTHQFRLGFCTLTQPPDNIIGAQDGHDMLLRPFLRDLKRKHGLRDYVWKYEQQASGQAHWHMVTSQWIHWKDIRWTWNHQLRRSGQLVAFQKRHGHMNPPSTQIKSAISIKKCLKYLGKEICKSIQNQTPTKGKIWDCSVELKKKRFADIVDENTMCLIDEAISQGLAQIIESEHCRIIKSPEPLKLLSPEMLKDYNNYIF